MPVWMQISVPTSMEARVMLPARQFSLAHLHRCWLMVSVSVPCLQHLSQFSEHLIMTSSVPALRKNYLAARHNLLQAGILSITETAA